VDESPIFGELLRSHRTGAGWTQKDLADHAGLADRTVRALERGQRKPYRQNVQALADALHLSEQDTLLLQTAARRCGGDASISVESVTPTYNLPAELTTLVNREREVADIMALLQRPSRRLLTLTVGFHAKCALFHTSCTDVPPILHQSYAACLLHLQVTRNTRTLEPQSAQRDCRSCPTCRHSAGPLVPVRESPRDTTRHALAFDQHTHWQMPAHAVEKALHCQLRKEPPTRPIAGYGATRGTDQPAIHQGAKVAFGDLALRRRVFQLHPHPVMVC